MKKSIIVLLVIVMLIHSVKSNEQQGKLPSFSQQMSKEGTASLGKILGSGLLSGLFSSGSNKKHKLQREEDSKDFQLQIPRLNSDEQKDDGSFIDKNLIEKSVSSLLGSTTGLPFDNLIPRRRKFSQLEILSKILADPQNKRKSNQKESKELEQLNNILLGKKQTPSENVFNWHNPTFRDGNRPMHHTKIFGKRGQGTKTPQIVQEQIEQLLVLAMPSLGGGKIIRMEPFGFKKGILLNIDYATENNQIFTIKAKYRPKKHLLDIISLIQNNNPMAMIDESSSSDSENQFSEFDVKPMKESRQEASNGNIQQTMNIISKLFSEQKKEKQISDTVNKQQEQISISKKQVLNSEEIEPNVDAKAEDKINEENKINKKQEESKQNVSGIPIIIKKQQLNQPSNQNNSIASNLNSSATKLQSQREEKAFRNDKLSKARQQLNLKAN